MELLLFRQRAGPPERITAPLANMNASAVHHYPLTLAGPVAGRSALKVPRKPASGAEITSHSRSTSATLKRGTYCHTENVSQPQLTGQSRCSKPCDGK